MTLSSGQQIVLLTVLMPKLEIVEEDKTMFPEFVLLRNFSSLLCFPIELGQIELIVSWEKGELLKLLKCMNSTSLMHRNIAHISKFYDF